MFSSKGTKIALNTRFLDDCGVKYLTGSDNDIDNDNNNDKNNDDDDDDDNNNNNNNKNVCYVSCLCLWPKRDIAQNTVCSKKISKACGKCKMKGRRR